MHVHSADSEKDAILETDKGGTAMISLGVDIGGTGCKCVAFRDDGTQLALSYAEYPVAAGTVNLPAELLFQSTCQVIAQCAAQLTAPAEIKAITVSSFGESFAAIDRNGQAIGDILMYFGNSDSEEFSALVEKIGTEKFMRIARILPDASYSLSKMLYTIRHADRPVWKFLFVAGFVCYRLCGNPVSDISLACRSLLYDVENKCWSEELLAATGIEKSQLPQVLPTGSIAGTILPELAGQLGLPEDAKVVIGSHDQIVNALGAGVEKPGEAVDTSGTCECITPLYSKMPESFDFQRNFACVPYLNTNAFVTYAYNISAGSVVRWYRDALGGGLQAEAAQRNISIYDLFNELCPAEPTDLMVLPFLQGMGGTPDVNPNAAGMIIGLTTQTRLPDIYRAILEGITFEMRYNQEKLAENGVRFQRLYACGGGAKSSVWLQIKADILGCEIIPVLSVETGAMGSAILGLAAVTGKSPFEIAKQFRRYGETVKADVQRHVFYKKRYEIYKMLRDLYLQNINVL